MAHRVPPFPRLSALAIVIQTRAIASLLIFVICSTLSVAARSHRSSQEVLMSQFRCVYLYCLLLLTSVFACGYAFGQSDPDEISQVLGEEILAPSAALHQIKSYILSRVAPPPSATSAQQWTEQARRLRQ